MQKTNLHGYFLWGEAIFNFISETEEKMVIFYNVV